MDFNKLNNNFSGLYSFANTLSEYLKPYSEMMKTINQNITAALENFAEKAKPFNAFHILAKHQFTYWKPLYPDVVDGIIDSIDVNKYLSEKIDDKSFIDYNELCDEMTNSSLLTDTNKAILYQATQAMNNGLYDLALIGIVTVFDGVLSIAAQNTTTSISKRLNEIEDKIDRLSEEQWESLDESDITAFGMYFTWTESMKGFQEYSEFNKPEKEPKSLNRHWISHGRKTTNATKLDCCKMINALYGLIYFGSSI